MAESGKRDEQSVDMGRLVSLDQYLNALAERTLDNSRQLKKGVHQRRNGMEDLYGVCFSENGDATNPARFYISISPDMVYLERFAFKFVIKPFTTTVKGATDSSIVTVDKTSLSVSDGLISPNPHDHTTQPHTHNVIDGMAFVETTSTDWRITIHGVDVTPYFEEQQGSSPLFSGRGIYPNNDLEEDEDDEVENFYDVLDVASVMFAEGKDSDARKLIKPEFKEVAIYSDAPFGVDAYLYLKYSHVNR